MAHSTQAGGIFGTVYNKDYLGFQEGGAFRYDKIADFLEFDKAAISKIAGVSQSSVRFDSKMPHEVKERLDEIANICLIVAEFFEGDTMKTSLWFKTSNPLLGNVAPRDMVRLGRYKKLLKFIQDAAEGIGP